MSAEPALLSTAFDPPVGWPIRAEGGGVLHSDTEGLTRYGISKKNKPDVDLQGLTLAQAKAISHSRYWIPVHGDSLRAPPAFAVFDTAVNLGVARAVRLLQAAVQTKQDGEMRPETMAAVDEFTAQELLPLYLDKRVELVTICAALAVGYWLGGVIRGQ